MAFFDHHMPKCDGVAATKRIREIEKEQGREIRFPIVALTADVQESAKQICLNAGMDGYLTKPLNQKVLAESLRTYCLVPPSASNETVTIVTTDRPLIPTATPGISIVTAESSAVTDTNAAPSS